LKLTSVDSSSHHCDTDTQLSRHITYTSTMPSANSTPLAMRVVSAVSDYSYSDCCDTTMGGSTAADQQSLKIVSFGRRVKVRRILHRQDYKPDEIDATWYTAEDLKDIHQDNQRTVKLLKQPGGRDSSKWNQAVHQDKVCARGLERFVYAKTIEEFHCLSRLAVLDPESPTSSLQHPENDIASSYSKVARPSVAAAQARARRDEQEATSVYAAPTTDHCSILPLLCKSDNKLGEHDVCANRATMLLAQRRARMNQRVGIAA
jgi:hypothetical protein